MKKTLLCLLAFIVVLSMLLVACGEEETTTPSVAPPSTTTSAPPSTTTSAPPSTTTAPTPTAPTGEKYGGIYRQALTVGPGTPIGYPPEALPDALVDAAPAIEGLMGRYADASLYGILATSWEVADDGKSITFNLRRGVKFHDGSDFNADVCKWNMEGMIEGKQSVARSWTSIDKVDDYTVRVNVTEYTNILLTDIAFGVPMISKKTFDEKGLEYSRWHPVGTGPFIFVDYERDAKLTFKRNPNYWDAPKPYLDGVEMVVIADATVRKLAFQRGDIFALTPQSDLDAKELIESGKYKVTESGGGPYVLIPDSMDSTSPWASVDVRFAASYALDRETLVEGLTFGFGTPAYQMFQSYPELNIPGLVKTEYDQEKARQLLRDAGYPNGFPTTLHSFVRVVPANYIEAVAAQLREVGIMVETDFPEAGKYSELRTGTWDGLMGHGIYAWENKNQTISAYFAGVWFNHCKKPAGWWEGFNASMTSKEPDNQLLMNLLEIMYNDMMVIPYLEKKGHAFRLMGVSADDEELYRPPPPLKYTWLDESLK